MWKQVGCGILAVAGMGLLMRSAVANKNFVPDWTFKGSSLGTWRTLGEADWRADNGEIVGTPRTAAGGWLMLDQPLQDVEFASTYRCAGGCRTGVMVRSQSIPDGIRGVYVALPDGQNPAATFALSLDSQGREVKREPLRTAGGMVRLVVPPPASATPGGQRSGARRARARTRQRTSSGLTVYTSRLLLQAKRMEPARSHSRRQHSACMG